MQDAQHFDAIVIGGGPAGSTAARKMATLGLRTLVLERARHPRYKACGGGVPARTVKLVGLSIEEAVEGEVSTIEVSHFGERSFRKHSAEPFAYMVMRDRFDALLLSAAAEAGAEVHEDEGARAIEVNATAVCVATERGRYVAPFAIGADGATGPTGRWTGLGQTLPRSAAYELEIEAPAASLERWEATANVDVGHRPWGYGWVFPKAGRLSVGLVLSPGRGRSIRAETAQYVERLGLRGASVSSAVGHPILYRRGTAAAIARGPVLLTGDAAGLADEFTAEGIAYAVHSGTLAAASVEAALGGAGQAAERYQEAVDRSIQAELDAARAISRMYYRCVTLWPRLALWASRQVDYFWRAFFRVMRGESRYDSELKRWPLLRASTRVL